MSPDRVVAPSPGNPAQAEALLRALCQDGAFGPSGPEEKLRYGAIFWRTEGDGTVSVGEWCCSRHVSGAIIQWRNPAMTCPVDIIEPMSVTDFLLRNPNVHALGEGCFAGASRRSLRQEQVVEFVGKIRRTRERQCVVPAMAATLPCYDVRDFNLSGSALLWDAPRQESTRAYLTFAERYQQAFQSARSFAEELRSYGIRPLFFLNSRDPHALESARMHAHAGWEIGILRSSFSPSQLRRFLTPPGGRSCPVRILEEPEIARWYGPAANSQESGESFTAPASEPVSISLARPKQADFLAMSLLAERLRRDDQDPGIFFHGMTCGNLTPRAFAAMQRDGARFYLARQGKEIAGFILVYPPALAEKLHSPERLSPGTPGKTSYIVWFVQDPEIQALSGLVYERLIEKVVQEERKKGIGTLVGRVHPLNERGIRAHAALGGFKFNGKAVVVNGIEYRFMYRLTDGSESAGVEMSGAPLDAQTAQRLIEYCKRRLAAISAFEKFISVCETTLERASRAGAGDDLRRSVLESLDKTRSVDAFMRAVERLELEHGTPAHITAAERLFRKIVPEGKSALRRTLKTFGVNTQAVESNAHPSLIPDQQVRLAEFNSFAGGLEQSVRARLERSPDLNRCYRGTGDLYYYGDFVLFDLLAGDGRDRVAYAGDRLNEGCCSGRSLPEDGLSQVLREATAWPRIGVDRGAIEAHNQEYIELCREVKELARLDLIDRPLARRIDRLFRLYLFSA